MSESELSWKKPLLLVAALAALGGGAYWLEYTYKPKAEAAKDTSKKPFDLTGRNVDHIVIQNGTNGHFTLKCLDVASKHCKPGDAAKWALEEPMKVTADENNGNSLVSNLTNLIATEVISLKEETPEKRAALLKDYGLSAEQRSAKSARKVEVTFSEGPARTVTVGETHPMGDTYFALVDQDESQVYLVPTYFKNNLENNLTYWRNKKLFSLTASKITRFEYSGPKGKLKAVRDGTDWTLETDQAGKSQKITGDIDAVDTFLSSAVFASAKDFHSEDKKSPAAKKALAGLKPYIHLKMFEAGKTPEESGASHEITLYQKKQGTGPSAFAEITELDPLFTLDPAQLNRLDKGIKDLRASRLIGSLDRFNSTQLELSSERYGKEPMSLVQKNGVWSMKGSSTEISKEKIGALLDAFAGTRMRDFVALKDAKPGMPMDTVTVTFSDDQKVRRKFKIWKGGEVIYTQDLLSSGHTDVGVTDAAIFASLPSKREALNVGFTEVVAPHAAPPSAAAPGAK